MISNRRSLLTTSALLAPAAVLAACSAAQTAAVTSTVEQAIARVQALMPTFDLLATGIALLYPASAGLVPIVESALSAALGIFNNLTSTMSQAQAQPLVGQITMELGGSLTAIQSAIAAAPASTGVSKYAPYASEAQNVLGLLEQFATGVQATIPTAAMAVIPTHLWIRAVK
jgi:hypothetical protein